LPGKLIADEAGRPKQSMTAGEVRKIELTLHRSK
jgi:hypothetical protein